MTQDRLVALVTISIELDLAQNIDLSEIGIIFQKESKKQKCYVRFGVLFINLINLFIQSICKSVTVLFIKLM